MVNEIWKDVVGYNGLYQVSNLGNIKSLLKNIIMKFYNNNGYYIVGLYNKQKRRTIKVHRIVAQAFIQNPENKPFINHINGVKTDNRLENLEWCTNSENLKHSYSVLGREKLHYWKGKSRTKPCNSKPILQYAINGYLIKSWNNSECVKKTLGINSSNIIGCCKGKRKTAGGFIWKYKN